MAESIVAIVLKQLSTFLSQEYEHLRGHRRGLQFINDELAAMTAFLKHVEADFEQNPQLQEWVKQVRDAAYDIEDVIDEFMLIFARRHYGGVLQNIYTTIKTLSARCRISSKINDIKCRVKDISDRHQRYKKDYGIQGTDNLIAAEDMAVRDIRQRALFLEEADLVGILVRKDKLLSHILDDDSHLKVVSVVGMGGSGKTTLIRRVYEDDEVKRQFGSHAWLTISQTFEIKSVLKKLIEELHVGNKERVPQEVESKDVDGLKVFLRDFLRERKYIIILDDIWSIDAWEALKYALPDCNCRSRVMLTTRIADVASASGVVYRMEALSDAESWTLFCSRLFEDKRCPSHLENVSRKILNKCEGLPLAIVSISGLLHLKDKNRLEEWEKVYRSFGSELEGTGKLDRVKKVLLLSYNDLPYYLKYCLLYVSLYPEDYRISSSYTIAQWISEGLVQDRAGLSSREIGGEYIKELLNRCLFQVASKDVDGTVTFFYIHDFVREIILSKAKEHGIITEVKGRYIEGLNNAKRLIIHDFINEAHENIQINHLRTLIMLRYRDYMFPTSLSKLLFDRSKLMKVLDLSYLPLENIPKEVFKLFHLKFLDLTGSQVKIIPKFIKNLRNLEYLNLADTKVTELPAEILGLGKLRQLYVFQEGDHSNNHVRRGFRAPNEIGGLGSLECLYYMVADNRKIVTEIGKLSQLRELGITELRREDGKQLCCTLEKLTNLRDFDVRSIKADEILDLQHSMSTVPQFLQLLKLVGRLEQMPRWIPSAQGLTQLQFARSELMEDPLEYLHVLPNLLLLELTQAYGGETLCFKAKGFQKLKQLRLEQLQRLRHVTIEEGAMPHLEVLTIVDCELVEELPQGIQNLSELQTVELNDMSEEVIAELRENMKKAWNTGFSIDGTWKGHYL